MSNLLNMRQIEVFRAVMVAGSITSASRMLNVAQPGITRMIRHMESRLKVSLFARYKGRLLPTPEAKALFREVERASIGFEAIQTCAASLKTGSHSLLRIVSSPNASLRIVPSVIADLMRVHPDCKASFEVITVDEMVRRLLADQIDVAVSAVQPEHPLVEVKQIGVWRQVCVMPKDHDLSAKREIDVQDLARYRVIAFASETVQARSLSQLLSAAGVTPNAVIEVKAGQVACALIEQGVGIAVIDDITASHFSNDSLTARPLIGAPEFPMSTLTSTLSPPSSVALRFLDILRTKPLR